MRSSDSKHCKDRFLSSIQVDKCNLCRLHDRVIDFTSQIKTEGSIVSLLVREEVIGVPTFLLLLPLPHGTALDELRAL